MRLTQQERWIAGFLVGTLLLGAGIRITKKYLKSPSREESAATAKTDSVFLAKVNLVDSLVRHRKSAEKQTPEVRKMVQTRQVFRVNVNTADQKTLEKLPRIGPALAKRIIAHRSQNGYFSSIKDLEEVKGIGPATVSKLQPYIVLKAATP